MCGSNGIQTYDVSNRTPYCLVQRSQLLHALLKLPQSYRLLATCLCDHKLRLCNHKLPLHSRHQVTDKPVGCRCCTQPRHQFSGCATPVQV
jgi:hypothetical protein